MIIEGKNDSYIVEEDSFDSGGQGAVFLGIARSDGANVVFKRTKRDEHFQRRIKREIEALTRVQHAHVMPILDAGEDANGKWFVMPLAEGNFSDLRNTLTDDDVVSVLDSVAQALEVAHQLGFVHRDVKPANVLALRDDSGRRWVLSDWGLVRQPPGQTTLTLTGQGEVGTPGFIAPEVYRGAHDATEAADVYSLGCMAAWAVTGEWPQPFSPLVPDGPWRRLIRDATNTDPNRRPSIKQIREMLNDISNEPDEPVSITAECLAERVRRNDLKAVSELIELARNHPGDAALYLDNLIYVPYPALVSLVRGAPDDARALVEGMSQHLRNNWGDRNYDGMNQRLAWIHDVVKAAQHIENFGLLEDLADELFVCDPKCWRFGQRRETRAWLEGLTGYAAAAVARALRRRREAVAWYLDEGWTPSPRDQRIKEALTPT